MNSPKRSLLAKLSQEALHLRLKLDRMKNIFFLKAPRFGVLAVLLLLGGLARAEAAAPAPLRVLLFSGQNNHDWKTTTPRLKSILTESGRRILDNFLRMRV